MSMVDDPSKEGGLIMEIMPPGFRFHPTDVELIYSYLREKVLDERFSPIAIGDVDLNKSEPWELPSKAKINNGGKEWYFYSKKDKKYPTGSRTNRATLSGYWKATGKDKEIYNGDGNFLVGMKKTLVFYKGRAPKGEKTNWVMNEFRLHARSCYNLPREERDAWVVCRVSHKNTDQIKKSGAMEIYTSGNDHAAGLFEPHNLPPLMGSSYPNSITGADSFIGSSSSCSIAATATATVIAQTQYLHPNTTFIPTTVIAQTQYLHPNTTFKPTTSAAFSNINLQLLPSTIIPPQFLTPATVVGSNNGGGRFLDSIQRSEMKGHVAPGATTPQGGGDSQAQRRRCKEEELYLNRPPATTSPAVSINLNDTTDGCSEMNRDQAFEDINELLFDDDIDNILWPGTCD